MHDLCSLIDCKQCLWLKESVKAPRSEALFEAMRKRLSALEAEIMRYKDVHGELPGGDEYFHPRLLEDDYSDDVLDLEYHYDDDDELNSLLAATHNLKVSFVQPAHFHLGLKHFCLSWRIETWFPIALSLHFASNQISLAQESSKFTRKQRTPSSMSLKVTPTAFIGTATYRLASP